VALPAGRGGLDLRSIVPSLKSIAVGVAILGLAAGAYAAALETSIFAVRTIQVSGGSPRVQAEVRRALRPELGKSLLRVDTGAVRRTMAAIPEVISVRLDRAFPHTLRIRIKPEHAVLLLRRATDSWTVSARGRVMRAIRNPLRSSLPRLWVPKSTPVRVGAVLAGSDGALAAAAVAPLARRAFPGGVRSVVLSETELTLVLRSGPQIRLGDLGDLHLKLAIARRILHLAGSAATTGHYIDVSVPERPVLGTGKSQVASTG
jgi:cell division protein FtsQ